MSDHEENGWKKVLHDEIDASRCRMRGGGGATPGQSSSGTGKSTRRPRDAGTRPSPGSHANRRERGIL